MRYAGVLTAAAAVATIAIVGRVSIDELPVAIRASRMVNIVSSQPAPYVVPQGRTLVMTGLQPAAYLGTQPVIVVTVNGTMVVRQDVDPFRQQGMELPPNLIAPSGSSVVVAPGSGQGVVILTGYLD